MHRHQGMNLLLCERSGEEGPALPRRAGAVPARAPLSRSQCLLELTRKLTGAFHTGACLLSAEGQLLEHIGCGTPAEVQAGEDRAAWAQVLVRLVQGGSGRTHQADLSAPFGSCGELKALWPRDLSPAGPLLTVSLLYPGRCQGVLYAARRPGEDLFASSDIESVRLVAACFEQGNLFEEAHLLTRIQLINQVAQAGAGSFDLSQVLAAALRDLGRHLPSHACAVWLLEDSPDPAAVLTEAAPEGAVLGLLPGARINPSEAFFASCLKDGQAVYLDLEWPEARNTPLGQRLAEGGATCCFAVPLRAGDQAVGVLQTASTSPGGFTNEQVQLLYQVADLLGPAISNCQLYGRVRGAYDQLQVTQNQLVQSEKMRALGELASGMAHDFNNALCGVLGFIELVLLDDGLAASSRKHLESARTCALDAAQTVRRVQDFARWRRNEMAVQRVDLHCLVRETVELTRPRWENHARGRGAVITVQVRAEGTPIVSGSPAELREVLTNLIFNAVDAMPKGGCLTLHLRVTGSDVVLAVQDTGVGMSEAVRRRLFEPFFTTKGEGGNGLGLSVAFGVVRRHAGEITVESEIGRGTTFTIRLPGVRGEATSASTPAEGDKPEEATPPRSLNILVIEDEVAVRQFLGMGLIRLGHQPVLTPDAQTAFAAFENTSFDVVLTDLGLPGISGEEVALQITQKSPRTPVVLLTGWADQILAERTALQGVACILGKPVTLDTLAATLNTVCPVARME